MPCLPVCTEGSDPVPAEWSILVPHIVRLSLIRPVLVTCIGAATWALLGSQEQMFWLSICDSKCNENVRRLDSQKLHQHDWLRGLCTAWLCAISIHQTANTLYMLSPSTSNTLRGVCHLARLYRLARLHPIVSASRLRQHHICGPPDLPRHSIRSFKVRPRKERVRESMVEGVYSLNLTHFIWSKLDAESLDVAFEVLRLGVAPIGNTCMVLSMTYASATWYKV